MTSNLNLNFSRLPADFFLYPVKSADVKKKIAYFLTLSCYFIDFRLKLLCAKFALLWTNIKVISSKENSNGSPIPNLFNLKEGQSFQS